MPEAQPAKAQTGPRNYQLYFKIAFLVLLVLGSLIPLTLVRVLVLEREGLSQTVKREVSATWGQDQRILGPVLTIPFDEHRIVQVPNPDKDSRVPFVDKEVVTRKLIHLLPETLAIEAEVATSVRRRGIYEVPLYTLKSRFDGGFGRPDLEVLGIEPQDVVLWDKARIEVFVADLSGSLNAVALDWGGEVIPFRLDGEAESYASRIVAPLPSLAPGQAWPEAFGFALDLNGSGSLGVMPLGKATQMSLASGWPHPGFTGSVLPVRSDISASGFTADWEVSHFARQIPQQWRSDRMTLQDLLQRSYSSGLITRLVEPVDHYLKTERSVKHGVLFVLLISAVIFAFEVMTGGRVHFIQYGMIAAALCIFYLLLLSFSEILGFAPAYAIAAGLSVSLITLYVAKIAGGWRRGGIVGAVLGAVYGYLYTTLQSEDHALIMGALLLFFALAALMFATRNVDWYSLGGQALRPARGRPATSEEQA